METPTEFVREWLNRICTNDPEEITSLYKDDAVLLGTLDPKVRQGTTEIGDYFKHFVTLRPHGTITYLIDAGIAHETLAVVNGTYVFELTEAGKTVTVPARFTFVLERTGPKWLILSHHSSKEP